MTPGAVIVLRGGAEERGHAQSIGADADRVRAAIAHRLAVARPLLTSPAVRDFLTAQRRFADEHCVDDMAEVAGIADGFAIPASDVFAFLHLGVLADVGHWHRAAPRCTGEGCSVWAVAGEEGGARVGKNRDFHGEQAGVQRLFEHVDPAWGARRLLCVGSLGAPGVYSSGINTDGLAVADTQVTTPDHGPGWLRYFTMSRILRRHGCVAEALDDVRGLRHAGGGTLVLGDAGGAVAAVDLGHRSTYVEEAAPGGVARTNHFAPGSVANGRHAGAMRASSEGRLARLRTLLATVSPARADALQRTMSTHDGPGGAGLCRHGQDGDARTLSASVFDCGARELRFSAGNPCEAPWSVHGLDG